MPGRASSPGTSDTHDLWAGTVAACERGHGWIDRQMGGKETDRWSRGQELGARSTGAMLSALTSSKRHKKLLDFSSQTGEMTVVLYNLCWSFLVQHSPTCPIAAKNLDFLQLYTARQLSPTLSIIVTFPPTNKLAYEACWILQCFKVNQIKILLRLC